MHYIFIWRWRWYFHRWHHSRSSSTNSLLLTLLFQCLLNPFSPRSHTKKRYQHPYIWYTRTNYDLDCATKGRTHDFVMVNAWWRTFTIMKSCVPNICQKANSIFFASIVCTTYISISRNIYMIGENFLLKCECLWQLLVHGQQFFLFSWFQFVQSLRQYQFWTAICFRI